MEPRDDELTSDELREVENDLRAIYARRNPTPQFTAQVMKQVRIAGTLSPESGRLAPTGKPAHSKPILWRWAVAGAMAASLALGAYVQQDRVRRAGAIADEQAADELMLSLQLAGTKINKARDAVLRRGLREATP